MKNSSETYPLLNDLAETGGVVILGGADDINIPLGELKQAFSIDANIYNRSVEDLSISNTESYYDRYVSPLQPESIMLHIGELDLEMYSRSPEEFDRLYHHLIAHIRSTNAKCEIVIISVRNAANHPTIASMNRSLRYIADSDLCQFADVTTPRVWNPRETRSVSSFVYSLGFVRPLTGKRPLGDMIRVLFCYNQQQAC